MPVDPFDSGQLPSEFAEAESLPAVRALLEEQVDMQFADLRVLMRLPDKRLAPHVGCNFTATVMILNQISGFSLWFFHNRQAKRIEQEEIKKKRRDPLSGKRFRSFIRAYYPRQAGEPSIELIASRLYEARNVLSHSLGVGDLKPRRQRRQIGLVKSDPPLTPADIVDLECQRIFPLAGVPVRRNGLVTRLNIPGLYWALGQMLRNALGDQPERCEAAAENVLSYFPVPRSSPGSP